MNEPYLYHEWWQYLVALAVFGAILLGERYAKGRKATKL